MLNDTEKQRIIAMVCADPLEGHARWTVRLVAEQAVKRRLLPRVGRKTIRVLLSHDLKPWREKMWCVPELTDEYIAKMEDVLEIYKQPYRPEEPVVCLDEKPVTLHADVRPLAAAAPGPAGKPDKTANISDAEQLISLVPLSQKRDAIFQDLPALVKLLPVAFCHNGKSINYVFSVASRRTSPALRTKYLLRLV